MHGQSVVRTSGKIKLVAFDAALSDTFNKLALSSQIAHASAVEHHVDTAGHSFLH